MVKKTFLMPEPNDEYGYTIQEMTTFMTKKEIDLFAEWIEGQTCTSNGKGEFVFYTHDVARFLESVRQGKPTYWD